MQELTDFFGMSRYGDEICEGIYVGRDDGDYLKYRVKMVLGKFRKSIEEHWSRGILQRNIKSNL